MEKNKEDGMLNDLNKLFYVSITIMFFLGMVLGILLGILLTASLVR